MLLKDDKKKMVTTIIGKLGSSDEELAPNEDGALQDDSVGLEACAEEMIQAFEQKSPKMVIEAMKSMLQMLQDSQSEEPPQEY